MIGRKFSYLNPKGLLGKYFLEYDPLEPSYFTVFQVLIVKLKTKDFV